MRLKKNIKGLLVDPILNSTNSHQKSELYVRKKGELPIRSWEQKG